MEKTNRRYRQFSLRFLLLFFGGSCLALGIYMSFRAETFIVPAVKALVEEHPEFEVEDGCEKLWGDLNSGS